VEIFSFQTDLITYVINTLLLNALYSEPLETMDTDEVSDAIPIMTVLCIRLKFVSTIYSLEHSS
jgi:hypothetical protein